MRYKEDIFLWRLSPASIAKKNSAYVSRYHYLQDSISSSLPRMSPLKTSQKPSPWNTFSLHCWGMESSRSENNVFQNTTDISTEMQYTFWSWLKTCLQKQANLSIVCLEQHPIKHHPLKNKINRSSYIHLFPATQPIAQSTFFPELYFMSSCVMWQCLPVWAETTFPNNLQGAEVAHFLPLKIRSMIKCNSSDRDDLIYC